MRGGDSMKTKVAKEYLRQLRKRYGKAGRREKHVILNELTKTAGYERKYAINLLRGNYKHSAGKISRPRAKIYTVVDAIILSKVCTLLDWIASKRVQPEIGIAIDSLVQSGELVCSKEQRKKLIKISPATIDHLLKTHKKRPVGKGRSYTKPGTLLKTQIPIRTFADWTENKVGFFEIDLCGHDGGVARGDFAWTLNFVDVKVQWTEQVAVFNKAQLHVFAGIKTIRRRLPFPLLGYDSDSGSEFINNQLYRYSIQEKITFTRGRVGKKNDNAFVEEKNDSVVRHWVGYGRYNTQEQVDVLNELYEVLRLYSNFFLPVQKLKEKIRIGSKVKKIHDKATTPYKRILRAKDVLRKVKNRLRKQYGTLNLVLLKRQIDEILKRLKPTPVR
jgi:polyhydroxyalkanoate synthesis regulator phasin